MDRTIYGSVYYRQFTHIPYNIQRHYIISYIRPLKDKDGPLSTLRPLKDKDGSLSTLCHLKNKDSPLSTLRPLKDKNGPLSTIRPLKDKDGSSNHYSSSNRQGRSSI